MSTTFDVFPSTKNLPTFDDVIALSNRYLESKLSEHGISAKYQIDCAVLKQDNNITVNYSRSAQAKWNDDEYAWFTVLGTAGGCDAYYWPIDDITVEYWNEDIFKIQKAILQRTEIENCLSCGIQWNFRRSVGQPAIINLSYGLIAAAFAKLTNGFIFSDDSAWTYSLFPSNADEFLRDYFNPDNNDEYGDWAKECLNAIKNGDN